jgi:hypothetical protein
LWGEQAGRRAGDGRMGGWAGSGNNRCQVNQSRQQLAFKGMHVCTA